MADARVTGVESEKWVGSGLLWPKKKKWKNLRRRARNLEFGLCTLCPLEKGKTLGAEARQVWERGGGPRVSTC